MRNIPEAQDEYGYYVFDVYELRISGTSKQDIADHLYGVEMLNMALTGASRDTLLPVAEALRRIDVSP